MYINNNIAVSFPNRIATPCHVSKPALYVTTLPGAVTCCDVSSVTGSIGGEVSEVFSKLNTNISFQNPEKRRDIR